MIKMCLCRDASFASGIEDCCCLWSWRCVIGLRAGCTQRSQAFVINSVPIPLHRLLQEREVVLYCDLHGHSRKQNVFIYGCESRETNNCQRLQERVFPAMLSKNAPDKVRAEQRADEVTNLCSTSRIASRKQELSKWPVLLTTGPPAHLSLQRFTLADNCCSSLSRSHQQASRRHLLRNFAALSWWRWGHRSGDVGCQNAIN